MSTFKPGYVSTFEPLKTADSFDNFNIKSDSKSYDSFKYNASNNETYNKNYHSQKPKKQKYDAPEQVFSNISTINLLSFLRSSITDFNTSLDTFKQALSLFEGIFRSIERDQYFHIYTIDKSILNIIQKAYNSEIIIPQHLQTYKKLTNSETILSCEYFTLIYRNLISELRNNIHFQTILNTYSKENISKSKEIYDLAIDLFIEFSISQALLQADKLRTEYDIKFKNISADTDYEYNQKLNELSQEEKTKFIEYKNEYVWPNIDAIKSSMLKVTCNNISNSTVNINWKIMLLDPFVDERNNLIYHPQNKALFYIENIDNFELENYYQEIKFLTNLFFKKYPNYENSTCMKQMFKEWREINVYREILIQLIKYKSSDRSIDDLIRYDNSFIEIIKTLTVKYTPFVDDIVLGINYSQINLESQIGNRMIQRLLNKLTDKNYDICENLLIRLYTFNMEDTLIKLIIENGVKQEKYYNLYTDLLCAVRNYIDEDNDYIPENMLKIFNSLNYNVQTTWYMFLDFNYRFFLCNNAKERDYIVDFQIAIEDKWNSIENKCFYIDALSKVLDEENIKVDYENISNSYKTIQKEFDSLEKTYKFKYGENRLSLKYKLMDAIELIEKKNK